MRRPAGFTKTIVLLSALLLISASSLFCQIKKDTLPAKFNISIRGKAFAFFVIEDAFFRTGTLGAELTYGDRHSLGIDFTSFRWRYENDDSKDSALYEDIERRRYILADYKFRFMTLKKQAIKLYVNLYAKSGSFHAWGYEPGKSVSFENSTALSKSEGVFTETGIGLGMKKHFDVSRFGFDLSANYGWRRSKTNIQHLPIGQGVYFTGYGVHEQRPVFYMRLNLFCMLGKGPFISAQQQKNK